MFAKSTGSGGKLISFNSIAFPSVGRHSAAFLLLFNVTTQVVTGRAADEFAFLGKGRTEITLEVAGLTKVSIPGPPVESISALTAKTLHLARALVGRARA